MGHGVIENLHAAGHVIDLDFGDMGAGAIGGLRRRVIGGVLEPRRLADRQRHAGNALRQARQLAERDGRLIARRRDGIAVFKIDIDLVDAERARRQRDDLLAHRFAGELRRAAGIDRLAAGEGADALGDRAGIADRSSRYLRCGSRPVRRRSATASCGCPGPDWWRRSRPRPCRSADAHGDALERTEPGALDIIADADADQAALFERRALALAEAFIAGQPQAPRPVLSDNRRCHRPAACRRGTTGRPRRASAPAG